MGKSNRKKLVINCNDCFALYTFRLELLKRLVDIYELYLIAREDDYYQLLVNEGFTIINSHIKGNKASIFNDLKLIVFYKILFKKIKPDIIINYTIKPHIYGSLVSKNTIVINFVSGVGSVFLKHNLLYYLSIYLYRLIKNKVNLYIFLNNDDFYEFQKLKLIKNNYKIINGEGVNLEHFYQEVDFNLPPTFLFIGRLVKEKGIYEYLEAAKAIKEKYPSVRFMVAGAFYSKNSVADQNLVYSLHHKGIIDYLGHSFRINEVLREVHVVVLPSYREGLPISLLEGLASKKFLIASDVPGCRDVCVDGYNGFLVNPRDSDSLIEAIEKYLIFDNKKLLHENAFNSVYQFEKKLYVEKMVEILEEI